MGVAAPSLENKMITAFVLAALLQSPAHRPVDNSCTSPHGATALEVGRRAGRAVADGLWRFNPDCDRFQQVIDQLESNGRGLEGRFRGRGEEARCRKTGFVEGLRQKIAEITMSCSPSSEECQDSATSIGNLQGTLLCGVASLRHGPETEICPASEHFCVDAYRASAASCGPGTEDFSVGDFEGDANAFYAAVDAGVLPACDLNLNNVID
jgi:hypothetical protein